MLSWARGKAVLSEVTTRKLFLGVAQQVDEQVPLDGVTVQQRSNLLWAFSEVLLVTPPAHRHVEMLRRLVTVPVRLEGRHSRRGLRHSCVVHECAVESSPHVGRGLQGRLKASSRRSTGWSTDKVHKVDVGRGHRVPQDPLRRHPPPPPPRTTGTLPTVRRHGRANSLRDGRCDLFVHASWVNSWGRLVHPNVSYIPTFVDLEQ